MKGLGTKDEKKGRERNVKGMEKGKREKRETAKKNGTVKIKEKEKEG